MADKADKADKAGEHEGVRVKVNDLPQPEHELSSEEQKGVQGGAMRSNTIGGTAGDDVTYTTQARQTTIGGASGDDELM